MQLCTVVWIFASRTRLSQRDLRLMNSQEIMHPCTGHNAKDKKQLSWALRLQNLVECEQGVFVTSNQRGRQINQAWTLQGCNFKGPVCKIKGDLMTEMKCSFHSYVFMSVLLCFRYLRMSLLYLQGEQVLLNRVRHVAPPYFYSSPERTNQTLVLERAFLIFSHRGGWNGGCSSGWMPLKFLHAGPLSKFGNNR